MKLPRKWFKGWYEVENERAALRTKCRENKYHLSFHGLDPLFKVIDQGLHIRMVRKSIFFCYIPCIASTPDQCSVLLMLMVS